MKIKDAEDDDRNEDEVTTGDKFLDAGGEEEDVD